MGSTTCRATGTGVAILAEPSCLAAAPFCPRFSRRGVTLVRDGGRFSLGIVGTSAEKGSRLLT